MSVKSTFNRIKNQAASYGANVYNYASGAVRGASSGYRAGYTRQPMPPVGYASIGVARGATIKGWDLGFKLGNLAGRAARALRDTGVFFWRGAQANIGKIGTRIRTIFDGIKVYVVQVARNVVQITKAVGKGIRSAIVNSAGYAKGYYEGQKQRPTHKMAYRTGEAIGRMRGLAEGSDARRTAALTAGGVGTAVGLYLGSRKHSGDEDNG